MKLIHFAAVLLLTAIIGCTTTQEIVRPGGHREYLIACGASLGWNICYDRANEVCPTGYLTVSEQPGFNRKELLIYCPPAGVPPPGSAPPPPRPAGNAP
jgi:hypothetical protein